MSYRSPNRYRGALALRPLPAPLFPRRRQVQRQVQIGRRRASIYEQRGRQAMAQARLNYVTIPRNPFPRVFNCKFKYGLSTRQAIPPLFSIGEYYLRSNSLYDPDFTGVGQQPYYRDQLIGQLNSVSGVYTEYCVWASKIKVTFVSDSSQTEPLNVFLLSVDSRRQDLPANPPFLSEMNDVKSAVLGLPANSSPVTLSMYRTVWSQDSITRENFIGERDGYSAVGDSTPNNSPLWGICWSLVRGTNSEQPVQFQVQVTYYAELTNRSGNISFS